NMSELAIEYPKGYGVSWGGEALIPSSKGCVTNSTRPPTINWQCLVDNGNFPVGENDVLLFIYYDKNYVGGQNRWPIAVTVGGGKAISVHGGWVTYGGNNCVNQTLYGMHEVWEAISDQAAGDCCDGELPGWPTPPDGGTYTGCLSGLCSNC